jgi:hypothetical protein
MGTTPRTAVRQTYLQDAEILGDSDTAILGKVLVSPDAPAWFKSPLSSNRDELRKRAVSAKAVVSRIDGPNGSDQRAAGIKGSEERSKPRCKRTELINPDSYAFVSKSVVQIGGRPEFMESPALSNVEYYREKNLLQQPVRRFEYAGQNQDHLQREKEKNSGVTLPNGKVMNKFIVSVDSPDFFKSAFEANRLYFETHGLKRVGGVQRLGSPEPQFKVGEPGGPARYDTHLDCRAPEQYQRSIRTGGSTPRSQDHTSIAVQEEHTSMPTQLSPKEIKVKNVPDKREEKVAKKLDKYEHKVRELRNMQRQLVEDQNYQNKQSKTRRASSAGGASSRSHHRSTGSSAFASRGSGHGKGGSAGGAASGKRLASRARSTRR